MPNPRTTTHEMVDPRTLVPYEKNAKTHPEHQIATLVRSIRRFGFLAPIVVGKGNQIMAGHARAIAAIQAELQLVPVVRADHLTPTEQRAYTIADNKIAELAEWDPDTLMREMKQILDAPDGGQDMLGDIGFAQDDLDDLFVDGFDGEVEEDTVPEPPANPVTKPGDLIVLGRHRLLCGDSTIETNVRLLLAANQVDLICTDPPYCSGGFQESGKSAGSVGTSATHKQVANDRLSTRGFQALLKTAFSNIGAPYLYSFTDWRMWPWLFDVVESSGFGVRSMVVWDKGTPGMGRGWRAQHELVMWGAKATPPFDKHASGHGNVIGASRTGNVNHTTEKPIELMAELLEVVPFCQSVADPFAGSGTTMMACEKLGRTCYAFEIDPGYCDVIVQRWEQLTGETAVRP